MASLFDGMDVRALCFVLAVSMSSVLVLASPALATEETKVDSSSIPEDESQLKCDACVVISQKFGDAFLSAEEKEKTVRLPDRQITEAAEGVCDEMWRGYSSVYEDGILRLAGPVTERESTVASDAENIWSQRLQDFCDELLAEVPSERQMYDSWAADHDSLETMLCSGEGTFSACSSDDFGNWPGDDDYEDYDDQDFDYIHDEF